MRTFKYICMFIAVLCAGLSAMMFWGQGFHTWCWQINSIIWIVDCYFIHRLADRLEDKLKSK